ncbi:DUF1289 domain-containing protein [Veronia pacifica]|uniref:Fe-S protein n=1 Tax=Veronia pacifica TaxID=1080227 RepID=A0A1C3ED81_9GAMM|nr:DUF1289 domain-containing protein [Veronia pacifica]ODA31201.1 Fe-S protein [Veronia pacifica]
MEQLDFFDVPSPCIGVCQVNNKGYCKGCFRSRDERFHWNDLSGDQRLQVIRLCRQRYLRISRARLAKQRENEYREEVSPQRPLFDDF